MSAIGLMPTPLFNMLVATARRIECVSGNFTPAFSDSRLIARPAWENAMDVSPSSFPSGRNRLLEPPSRLLAFRT